MARTATQIRPFVAAEESWDIFMTRFDCFLEANDAHDLPDNRKRALFLHHCGPAVLKIAIALAAPAPIQSVDWPILKSTLRAHFGPTPSKFAQRYVFRQRLQREGESISEFAAALREAALQADYRSFLDDALLEQFLCGIQSMQLRQMLLHKHDLTWQMALEEARSFETSNSAAARMQQAGVTKPPMPASGAAVHHGDARFARSDTSTSEDDDPEGAGVFRTEQLHRPRRNKCASCGGDHARRECRFRDATCRRCGKTGHIARACRSAPTDSDSRHSGGDRERHSENGRHRAGANTKWPTQKSAKFNQVTIGSANLKPEDKTFTEVEIDGSPVVMEIDTGSPITILSWHTTRRLLPHIRKTELQPQPLQVRDFQGNRVPVLGVATVHAVYGPHKASLPVTIVGGSLPSLMGWNWIRPLGIGLYGVRELQLSKTRTTEDLLTEFTDIFDGTLGKYVGTPINFNLDPGVAPIRIKARRVPFAIKPKIDAELDKLVQQGILVPVDHARWETPIVTPIKSDGSIRICADYKATLNKALQKSAYPVPVVQHLLHSLGTGQIFAKLDLAQAYQQLPVDEATAEAQTIVTHRGAFKCTRLQFGVSVAPGLFQNLMERLLHGIPGVVPYFDDVLISAKDTAQLMARLREVFKRVRDAGLKLKKGKCQIGVPSVEFLGYRIDGAGIHPTETKVRAIQDAPTPKDKTELQAFLGLLNFYAAFLKQKATTAEPLHKLIAKDTPWAWGQREARAFENVKKLLTADSLLIQFNQTLPVVLACDASPFGVGAVLSHRLPNGTEAPIAYFSRTLSKPERNYSQLDKEALAAVAGVKKFHEYLFGRRFELVTDHRPLLGLLAGDRPTPAALSPRLTRWSLFLAAYDYALVHRPGKELSHADALSRCPLPRLVSDPTPGAPTLLIDAIDTGPLSSATIAKATRRDNTLRTVMGWVQKGWPRDNDVRPPAFKDFMGKRDELATHGGCLLRGDRVVVPEPLREQVLELLHKGHPGIVRMKGLARSYVWWPQMDKTIEQWVEKCSPCQATRADPPTAPFRVWEKPRSPWSRIHIDLAGPFHGQQFLIVVDALSKWVEIVLMKSTTTDTVIRVLRRLFATHGLPDILVSDNGPQFTAIPFENYLAQLGIRHALSAPYKPSSNGQAERFVRSAKEALIRMAPGDWQERVDTYLTAQHSTPSPITGLSPAEVLMGRKLRGPLDRLHPSYSPDTYQEGEGGTREFEVGQPVFTRGFGDNPKWIAGRIRERTGPKSYTVQTEQGRTERRHLDQIRRRTPTDTEPSQETANPTDSRELIPPNVARSIEPPIEDGPPLFEDGPPPFADGPPENSDSGPRAGPCPGGEPRETRDTSAQQASPANTELRRSSRVKDRPAHLRDYVCNNCRNEYRVCK